MQHHISTTTPIKLMWSESEEVEGGEPAVELATLHSMDTWVITVTQLLNMLRYIFLANEQHLTITINETGDQI